MSPTKTLLGKRLKIHRAVAAPANYAPPSVGCVRSRTSLALHPRPSGLGFPAKSVMPRNIKVEPWLAPFINVIRAMKDDVIIAIPAPRTSRKRSSAPQQSAAADCFRILGHCNRQPCDFGDLWSPPFSIKVVLFYMQAARRLALSPKLKNALAEAIIPTGTTSNQKKTRRRSKPKGL